MICEEGGGRDGWGGREGRVREGGTGKGGRVGRGRGEGGTWKGGRVGRGRVGRRKEGGKGCEREPCFHFYSPLPKVA